MRLQMVGARSIGLRAVVLASIAILSGCGGGDGADKGVTVVPGGPSAGPSPIPGNPSPAPSPTAEQLEYQRSNSAVAAQADAAYRRGTTGKGIRIALIDTGITPGLTEFQGRIDPASADMTGTRGLTDSHGHGTWVASVALAARDGRGLHGVAFEATAISLNVSRADACSPQQCAVGSAMVTRAIDAAVASGARVINMSFGSDDIDENLLAAVRRAAAAGVVMVVSAGNQGGGTEPRLLARSIAAAAPGLVIIAGGHDAAEHAFTGGNQAGMGSAAAWYLAALAVDVNMTGRDGAIVTMTGNSAATAAISGAVALVAQARPDLSGAQIVSLLLSNATDAGAPGRDPVFGNGILNLAAIFSALDAGR